MLKSVPAYAAPTLLVSIRGKFYQAIVFSLALLGFAPLAQAERVTERPQARTFTEAYQVALDLASQQPGSRLMTVASTYSMYPTLDWDSIVVIAPATINQIQVGDIVCFRDQRFDGQHKVVHRVEKILRKDHRLVTRGDHLERADLHPVGADTLIGRVVYAVYFDRTAEERSAKRSLPTPERIEQVVRL